MKAEVITNWQLIDGENVPAILPWLVNNQQSPWSWTWEEQTNGIAPYRPNALVVGVRGMTQETLDLLDSDNDFIILWSDNE